MTDYKKLINQCDEQIDKLVDVSGQLETSQRYYVPDLDYDFLISVVAAYKMNLRRQAASHE